MTMHIRHAKALLALATLVATQVSFATTPAIQFEDDSAFDAGFGAGSFDDFGGRLLANGTAGQSNAVLLEDLAPGVSWSSFTLTFRSIANVVEDSDSGLTFGASSGPTLTGSFLSKADDSDAYIYTYQFAGPLQAGSNYLSANGDAFALFGKEAVVNLRAVSAIPEPNSTALVLAGLGALALVAKRRRT